MNEPLLTNLIAQLPPRRPHGRARPRRVLDKTEMRSFVEATITQSGINKTVTDAEFDQIFQQFDLDNSTTIEKDEMAVFVKRMAGF